MNWLKTIWPKLKAWGDAWLGEWFDPTPIQEIDHLDTNHGIRRVG